MKHLTQTMMTRRVGMLGACLLTTALLLSCSKTPVQERGGKEIRFGALTSPAPQTKTAYTGVESGGKERIDWTTGDYVRIYSDHAYCVMKADQKWADYRLATPVIDPDSDAQSWAEIVPVSLTGVDYHGGLQFDESTAYTYNFYGFYPSPASAGAAEFNLTEATISGMQIATEQTVTPATVKDIDNPSSDLIVYYPAMSGAYMLAHLQHSHDPLVDDPAATHHHDLVFKPAYTAFHIGFTTQTAATVKSVALRSTSSNLTGTYTAKHDGTKWNYTRTGDVSGSTATKVSTTDPLGVVLAAGGSLEVELFSLPLDATNLTLDIIVDESGVTKTYSIDLKVNSSATSPVSFQGTSYNAGDWLTFKACRKVYLRGLLLPGVPWTIDDGTAINVQTSAVAPWSEEPADIDYGSGPVINAGGLTEENLSSHIYDFSIYAPTGKEWKIEVLDYSTKLPVNTVSLTRLNPNGSEPTDGNGSLTGTIGGGPAAAPALVRFQLGGTTGGKDCILSFSVTVDGRKYSINSEIVRGAWGTDYQLINF